MTRFDVDIHSMATGNRWSASCLCEEDVFPPLGSGITIVQGVIAESKSITVSPLLPPRVLVKIWHLRVDDDEKVADLIARMKAVGWLVAKD